MSPGVIGVTRNSDDQREECFPPGPSGFTAGEEKGAATLCWDPVYSYREQATPNLQVNHDQALNLYHENCSQF